MKEFLAIIGVIAILIGLFVFIQLAGNSECRIKYGNEYEYSGGRSSYCFHSKTGEIKGI